MSRALKLMPILKIKLDECISHRIALAVMSLTEKREGYEVSYVKHGGDDRDWIRQFAKEGGTAIVSGDHDILQHWPNLVAYTESGLISFFPPKPYQELKGYGRAAFLIRWWPAIVDKIKVSSCGDRWRLPMIWQNTDHLKMDAIKDPRIDDDKKNEESDTTSAEQDPLDLRPPPSD